jgi:hypothetical protein
VKAHYQSGDERRKNIAEAGAVGSVMILNPQTQEVPWTRVAGARFSERMELQDAASRAPWPKFAMTMNPARADKLLAGSGHSFQEITAGLGRRHSRQDRREALHCAFGKSGRDASGQRSATEK